MDPREPKSDDERGSNGCLTAVLVIGGILAALAVAGIVAMVVFARSDRGKRIVDAVGKGSRTLAKGMGAPGTKELRALGCRQALVVDLRDVIDVIAEFRDGGAGMAIDDLMVLCQGGLMDSLPDCDTVASTYAAVPERPDKAFIVVVKNQQHANNECMVRYSRSGANLGPVHAR